MGNRRGLAGLALAAVECTAQHIRRIVAHCLQRAPEVGGCRLIGNVLDLSGKLAALDPEKPLAGELEVVALHVDRPGFVPDDVDTPVYRGDQLLNRWTARPRL